ncbi:MAG TPA: ubiquitin-like protein UBact [Nitrospiria bacterium]|jgi:hypothetical protein
MEPRKPQISQTVFSIPFSFERRKHPIEPIQRPLDKDGPRKPDVGSPEKDNLLKRMRKVDPKQAERYRQRTGE